MNFRRAFCAIARLDSWLGRKRSPFAKDAIWAKADAAEKAARKAHKTTRPHQAAKSARLHAMLAGGRDG